MSKEVTSRQTTQKMLLLYIDQNLISLRSGMEELKQ